MTKKLPIGNYRFIKYFNRNRYLNSDYSCLINCEFYTTNKVKNNSILKQFPALISKNQNFKEKILKIIINLVKN